MNSDLHAVDQAITTRMSARAFTAKPVPREVLTHLLELAARSPSGTNTQPWKVYVLQGAAKDNPESLAIVRAVVAMADSLDMSTTAEGVETEAELDMIRKLGCKKIQGYYFGRPMNTVDALSLFGQTSFRERAAG